MRIAPQVVLTREQRAKLEVYARGRRIPARIVLRARIVLLAADGVGTNEIMRQIGTSKTCVWRWQERFMQEGIAGLLRDKTRPARVTPLSRAVAGRVVALTLTDPPCRGHALDRCHDG